MGGYFGARVDVGHFDYGDDVIMEFSALKTGATVVTAIGVIAGGAYGLNEMHVPAAEYEKHLKNEERQYVLELKRQIRELQKAVREGDEYAVDYLADAIATLCELRPSDKLCK